jgi:hypothetical protein
MDMPKIEPLCCDFEAHPNGSTFFDINRYYLEEGGNETQSAAVETFFTQIGKNRSMMIWSRNLSIPFRHMSL